MQTCIRIEHTTVAALKAAPIWQQIMDLLLAEGDVSVIEVEAVSDDAAEQSSE